NPGAGNIIARANCESVRMLEGTVYAPIDPSAGAINRSGDGTKLATGQPTHTLEQYLAGAYKNSPEGNYVSVASDINGRANSYPRKNPYNLYIPVLEEKFKTPITFRIHDTGGDFGAWGKSGTKFGPKTRANPQRQSNPELF